MLGILLNDFCITYHIAPEALTKGLCNPDMLKKYGKNTEMPEKLLGDALWQRIGKSVEKFDVFLEYDEFQSAIARIYIQLLIRHGKLKEAEDAIYHYRETKAGDNPLHIQFLCLQSAEIYRRKKAPYDKQMKNLRKGIRQTIQVQKLSPEIAEKHLFSLLELLLLERYVFLLGEKEPSKAASWYPVLEKYLTQTAPDDTPRDVADNSRLLPPLYYHYALHLVESGKYAQALEKLNAGIDMLCKRQGFEALFLRTLELRIQILQKINGAAAGEISEIAILKTLRQEFMENGAESFENIYPDYPERNIFCVNNIFRERRIALGMDAEEMALLADCDVRTLQAAERCQRMPQYRTKKKFFNLFRLTMCKYSGMLNTRSYEFYRACADIIDYNYHGKNAQAEEIYKKIVREAGNKDDLTNQEFRDYWDIHLRYKKGILSKDEFHDALLEMLQRSLPKCDAASGQCSLTRYERNIFVDLVWNMDSGDRLGLEDMLRAQYQRFHSNEIFACIFPDYYMALARCLARFFRLQKKFEDAEKILEDALKQIHFLQDDFRLQNLCLERFWLEMDKRKAQGLPYPSGDDEACRWIRYAYAISKRYALNDVITKRIEKHLDERYGNKKRVLGDLL